MTNWAEQPMLKDPVALSFGKAGLFVVETARRSTVDIDIRSHKNWILEDLANQSVEDLRDFFRRKMSAELSIENQSWLIDRNDDGISDWRDLTTVNETVRLLVDSDKNGKADQSSVFASGFNEEINGVAAGVLPVDDFALMTIYPDLWKLKDINADGVADEREIMFRGFGVHAAFDGHDLHGLTVGPEGKIYFSVGDNGFSVRNQEGQVLHHPNTGGVLRMNPDGSDLEVYSYGTRNIQEIAYDKYGNWFSVDNDGDLENERERFVHLVEGGDSGWRLNWQFRSAGWAKYTGGPAYNPWIERQMWIPHFDGQPAYIVPPISNYSVGPGGFKFNPGTALNSSYKDFFFLCQFPVKKITAFRATPSGATFQMADEHIFHEGLMASALNFGFDGALYIADWIGKWQPNDQGIIYRVDSEFGPQSGAVREARNQVAAVLNHGLSEYQLADIIGLLHHDDQRVRLAAQFELVNRDQELEMLRLVTNSQTPQLARIHAIWGLTQLELVAKKSLDRRRLIERLPWTDADSEIRSQLAKFAGDIALKPAKDLLQQLSQDGNMRVRYFAAASLGKIGDSESTDLLFKLLATNANRDAVLRHGAIMGLVGCATTKQLSDASNHPSRFVRSGCVVALRRRRDPAVSIFLTDKDPWVAKEAASAIHDDFSIPDAMPKLAALIDSKDAKMLDETIVRRCLSACLRLGRSEDCQRLLRFAFAPENSASLRAEAMACLGKWNSDPLYDRVDGRVRKLSKRQFTVARKMTQRFLKNQVEFDPALDLAITKVASELGLDLGKSTYLRWIRSAEKSVDVRVAAFRSLADAGPSVELNRSLQFALDCNVEELRILALEVVAQQDPEIAISRIEDGWNTFPLREKQAAIALLGQLDDAEAYHKIESFLRQSVSGNWPAELQLDLELAAKKMNTDEIQSQLAEIVRRRQASSNPDSADAFSHLLFGGDRSAGETIYRTHVSAQCVRCHEAGGIGKQAGPVLQGIGKNVSRKYLLEALLFPSQAIAKGFETTTLITTDGIVANGTIVDENDERIILADNQGKRRRFETAEIDERSSTTVSTMPEVGKILSEKDIRDLVEFLSNK